MGLPPSMPIGINSPTIEHVSRGISTGYPPESPPLEKVPQFTLEPALKCVPRTPMTSAAPVGVSGCEMLHSPREVGPWRPYQQVEVIGHQDKAEQVPSQPANNRFQALDEPLVVAVVAEHRLSGVAPRHHVVDRAGKFDPQGSSHALSLASVRPTVNRKQGLTPRSLLIPRSLLEQILNRSDPEHRKSV